MRKHLNLLLCFAAVAAASSSVCRAENADEDRDPLPPLAIARLGTTRLYNPRVQRMLFAPGGKLLATIDAIPNPAGVVVGLWDVVTGKQIRQWKVANRPGGGGGFSATAMAFSHDDRFFAVGARDEIHLWETATGADVLSVPAKYPRAVAFAPDGRSIATLTQSGAQVYEFPNGKLRFEHSNALEPGLLAYSRNGKRLIAVGFEMRDTNEISIRRWDVADGTPQPTLTIPHFHTYEMHLSPNGETLAAPETPRIDREPVRLRRWNTTTGKQLDALEGPADFPPLLHYTLDGSLLTAPSRQGRLRVWDNQSGKLLHDIDGHVGSLDRVALSSDGKVLAATVHNDDAIHFWDLASGKELHRFNGHRTGPLVVAFTADGRSVLTTSCERIRTIPPMGGKAWSLRRWDARTGKETTIAEHQPRSGLVFAAITSNGSLAATAEHLGGRMRIYETGTGKERCSGQLPTHTTTNKSPTEVRQFDLLDALELVFAPDGKTVAASRYAGSIGFWDTASGKLVHEIKLPDKGPMFFCFAPDGNTVLVSQWQSSAGPRKYSLVQIDVRNGETIRTFGLFTDFGNVAVSVDGRLAASVSARAGLQIWDMETGKERWKSNVPASFGTLAFAPDGRLLASGGVDGKVRLWDTAAGNLIHELDGHDGAVASLAWSPDSRHLVSAAGNAAIIWDISSIKK
jgi:WD40 repeat protein